MFLQIIFLLLQPAVSHELGVRQPSNHPAAHDPKAGAASTEPDPDVTKVLPSLASEDPGTRLKAVDRLQSLGPREAVISTLVRVLRTDQDDNVSYAAAQVLQDFGPAAKSGVPALIDLTAGDPTYWPSVVVVPGTSFLTPFDLLQAVGRPAAVDLIRILDDKDPYRRYHAACTLSDILYDRKPNRAERLVLARIAVPDEDVVTPALRKALEDKSDGIRLEAAKMLNSLDRESKAVALALSALVLSADPEVAREAGVQLGKMGDKAAGIVRGLAEGLKAKEPRTRRAVAEALKQMGLAAKEAIPALIESLKDDDLDVRKAAKEALEAIR